MNVLRSRAIVVILILALTLAWMVLDQTGKPNPIRDTVSYIVSPVQFALQRMAQPAIHVAGGISHLLTLQKENHQLRDENSRLRNQIVLLQEAQIENETLRQQLDFKSVVPNYRLLSAEVIGRDPSNLLQYLIIDRGAADGVERGMPVMIDQGLVGRISEVSINSSKVMLLTDASSSVSAIIQRTRATGMVQGYPGHELIMRYIPQGDTVAPGDLVLTSGLGESFPKRLVIGQVASVTQKDVEIFQEARLVPLVNLHDLESVMVLLSFAPEQTPTEGEPVESSQQP